MNAITQPEVNALTVSKESAYGLLMDSNGLDNALWCLRARLARADRALDLQIKFQNLPGAWA